MKSCAEKHSPIHGSHFIHLPCVFQITLGIRRCPTWRASDAETLFPQPSYSILHKTLLPQGGVCSLHTPRGWLQVGAVAPAPLAAPCTCRHHDLIGENSRNIDKDWGSFLLRTRINNRWHLQGLKLMEGLVPESSWELCPGAAITCSNCPITPCSTNAHKQSAGISQGLAGPCPVFSGAPQKRKGTGTSSSSSSQRHHHITPRAQELSAASLATGTPRETLPVIHLFRHEQKSKPLPNFVFGRQKMRAETFK